MAVKIVHISDVSDKEGSQEELGTLEVLEHPEIGEPARLEIFPDEFEQLQSADRIVRLRWTAPGSRRPQELTVLQETFDRLAQDRDMRPDPDAPAAAPRWWRGAGQGRIRQP
jgi:hypothetical protein